MSYSQVATIERGNNTSVARIEQLCALYDLDFLPVLQPKETPEALLDLSNVPAERREVARQIADTIGSLTDQELDVLHNLFALLRIQKDGRDRR